jgi:tetratricopeptide (TPR) repeat protein
MMDAIISGRAGVAVIVDGEEMGLIRAEAPDEIISGYPGNIGLLLGDARDIEIVEDVEKARVEQLLLRAQEREDALDMTLILLDGSLSEDVRAEAAEVLEDLLGDSYVVEKLERVLYARELPKGADLEGGIRCCRLKQAKRAGSFLLKLGERQGYIKAVWNGWNGIALARFATEQERSDFYLVAVREGLVRRLVEKGAKGEGIDGFIFEAIGNPAVQAFANYRDIVRDWAGAFNAESKAVLVAERIADTKEQDRKHDGRKPRRHRPKADEILQKVELRKGFIVKTMKGRRVGRVMKYVEDLIKYQQENGENKHICKSLCDLAMEAKDLDMHALQLELVERALDFEREDRWALVQYGDALKGLNRLPEALDAYDKVISEHPEDVFAKTGRAEVLKVLNRLPKALDAYDKIIAEHPESVVIRNGRAEVLKAMNRLPDALDAYEKIIAEHPESVVARNGRAEVLKALNRLPDALDAYEKIIAEHPEDVFARNGRAEVLKALNRLPDALDAYDKVIAEHPYNVFAQTGRAEVLKALNRLPDALDAYDKVIAEHPYDVFAQNGRAEVLKALNRLPEVLDAYDKIIAEHPESVVAKTGRAEVLKVLNRLPKALDAYDKIIAKHPESVVARNGRAEVLNALNRLPDALDAYDKIIAEHPESVVARSGRAEVLKALNRLPDALDAYEKIMTKHPYDVVAQIGCACVLAALERWDEALAGLPEKEPVTESDWIGYHVRGMVLLRRGDTKGAIEIFEKGMRENPRPAHRDYFRTALGVARLRQKEYKLARDVLGEVTTAWLQTASNMFLVHACGRLGERVRAHQIYETLPREPGPLLKELQDELHWQCVAWRVPRRDEEWIVKKETEYLLLTVAA